jgi:hypothetical protein
MNQMETKGLLHDTKSQTRGLFFIHLILLAEQPLPAQYARNIGHMYTNQQLQLVEEIYR